MSDGRSADLRIAEEPAGLAQALADCFVDDATKAIAERGAFFVALAGGTTPKTAYGLLAQPPRRERVDWNHVFFYFGDERCVPPESPESNYRMASETFLDALRVPADHVHRMHGEREPAQAAHEYAQILIQTMGDQPCFDLVLLGMGADGHTASLFPGIDPLKDNERLVRATYVEKLGTHRLSLTPLAINNARHVVVAVEGLSKAPALFAVREGPYDPLTRPIQIVQPTHGRLTWLVDRAAAGQLPRR